MSVRTAHSGNNGDALCTPSQKGSSESDLSLRSSLKLRAKSDVCEHENDDPLLGSARRRGDINCTYVLSPCKRPGDSALTPRPAGRLALQRRVTRSKESSLLGSEAGESPERAAETPLTLQRHTRPGATDRRTAVRAAGGALWETTAGLTAVSSDASLLPVPSAPSAAGMKDTEPVASEKGKEGLSFLSGADQSTSLTLKCLSHSTPVRPGSRTEVQRSGHLAMKPVQSKWDIRVSGQGNWHHRSAGKNIGKNTKEFASLEKRTPTQCPLERRLTPQGGTMQLKRPAVAAPKAGTLSVQVRPKLKGSLLENKGERPAEHTLPPQEETVGRGGPAERGPLQVESSQVTVAVRVRPFSKRERDEDSAQVVFVNGEEIAVRHPDTGHVYTFVYDVSFWSFDENHPHYAGQATVYGTLAAPLLARALEGYNACLFAYGQTGSGKSYTMMGFGEKPGIIPRFCEDLFAQVAKTPEVQYHIEMSFFEVYNEKIHDLLVCTGESGQTKQPLRVREHPVSGPYVEALAVNAVSSYSDVQGWLELGSKQRATAATGMNDKSSRSHAVLSLLMTRTQVGRPGFLWIKTECVDGEELEHRVTSRVNLVDLAGSERCGTAGTCGQQLREGVSINKSLLTLGKVVSALAEHGRRKGVFVPYRESVLTWLLKESLGGNSKTAIVATVSPAASSVEETLSTLRYARQARSIVNVARVNEDASTQLIRDLKAEIEKLKAAQRCHQNIDPERYRLCRQEITALRMQLHRQERDMAEMQRAWKEKFEEAEKRKHQEMEELQKAGITFHMDAHSPSLVNLSADPQLSETLFYVIKEGTTTVGKCGPTSSPDIRLSGVLVAEDHCTIRRISRAVSLVPVGEAKTYVNGRLVLEPTELHHGDRVVLGGDHYFRFNHPAEGQAGKRLAGADAPTREGPEDFEFAKNELLEAQRTQLEAEVKEAQLRAKQELLRAAQIAQEVATRELAQQQAAYEHRIEALEAQLKEESRQKERQAISNQKATHRIEELEQAKQRLEQEVHVSRRRLEVESLAAKQALEDHSVRHTRILEALEAERQKLAEEVQALQRGQGARDRTPAAQPGWGALKLSLMLQEANAISRRLHGQFEFGRYEPLDKGCGTEARVRVRNLQLSVSTVWSLEKFESKLATMKELYETDRGSQSEDLFCDPEDEWEADLAGVPDSSLSRRRSRSLARTRRVSSFLHGVQVPSAREPPLSSAPGSTGKPGCMCSRSWGPRLPGICRDTIHSSLAVLGQSHKDQTVADSLMRDLFEVHQGLLTVSQAHADQDEDSQDDMFSNCDIQALMVHVTCAFGRLAGLTEHWPGDAPPGPSRARAWDELRQEVRKLGIHLQTFLQGCCSDLPSVVEDAQRRVVQAVRQAATRVGQLAVLSGSYLHLPGDSTGLQEDLLGAVRAGVGAGLSLLLGAGVEKAAAALRHQLLGQRPRGQVARQMSTRAAAFAGCLGHAIAEWKMECSRIQAQGGNSGCKDLEKMVACASEFLKLERSSQQTAEAVLSALRGCGGDADLLRTCVERVCSTARDVARDMGAASVASCRDLESEAEALLLCFESEERPASRAPGEAPPRIGRAGQQLSSTGGPGSSGHKGVPKRVFELPTSAPQSPQGHPPSGTQWV